MNIVWQKSKEYFCLKGNKKLEKNSLDLFNNTNKNSFLAFKVFLIKSLTKYLKTIIILMKKPNFHYILKTNLNMNRKIVHIYKNTLVNKNKIETLFITILLI